MSADSFYGSLADLVEKNELTPREWRGGVRWGRAYARELTEWARASWNTDKARPPAFQDGKARPEQLLPGTLGAVGAVNGKTGVRITKPEEWAYWLIRSGRGWGKTETGAQAIIEWARKGITPLLVAGRTAADVRDTMVEFGPSAIMRIAPHDFQPHYEPSKRRLTFPNGVEVATRSADEPEGFRGVQFARAWLDELAAWNFLTYAWEQITLVMRVKRKERVQVVITTTPRNVKVVKDLTTDPRTALTIRPSYDNLSNLADDFRVVIEALEGTRAGRQEVHGEIVEDTEGALWTQTAIDEDRISPHELERRLTAGELKLVRVVLGVDPPGGERTEAGIVVVARGSDRHAYVVDDASLKGGADVWPDQVVATFRQPRNLPEGDSADLIAAEVNYGGDMVEKVIQGKGERRMPVKVVRATRGKAVRAEPVSMLYGRHLVHHVGGYPRLEGEQTGWVPDQGLPSPNRMDALVWALTELYGLYDDKEKHVARMPQGDPGRLMPRAGKPRDPIRHKRPKTSADIAAQAAKPTPAFTMAAGARGRR